MLGVYNGVMILFLRSVAFYTLELLHKNIIHA